MAFVVKDRVKETSTSTGTGSFTLSGAVAGFQTFASTLINGDTTYYAITDAGTGDFEVGLGTYNSGVLSRDTVFETHNGVSLVDFNAGEKEVFITYPADKAVYLDADGKVAPTTALMNTIKANDGAGSGLNADLLDGLQASDFVLKAGDTVSGDLIISGDLTVNGTTTTVNATNLAIADNMIYMNEGSTVTNPDLGWSGNYNDGTYAHAGFFRDATDSRFKAYDGYTPEPDASPYIDTSHASFSLADIEANTFYGNLTGTATNANKWTTARTITLGGDLTGSVSIDGTANVVLTAAINDDSHFHVISNIDGLQVALDSKADDTTLISAGTGLTGGGSIGVNRTLSLDTTYTDGRYVNATGDTMTGNLTFGDNNKAIFGAGSDLQIYHDGSHSYIKDAGTGNIIINGGDFRVNSADNTANMITANSGGAVTLYYDNAAKLATTSTGIDVTGNITLSGTVDGRDVAADGTKLDGIEAGATADQTITAGSGLVGGGTGNVTLSHADTSSQASVNNSGRTYIQDITLDTYGHITGITSATETVTDTNTTYSQAAVTTTGGAFLRLSGSDSTNDDVKFASGTNTTVAYTDANTITISSTDTNTTYSAGSGLSLVGTTFSHTDTSSQGSVINSGATVIQDVTLDTYGHVTGLASTTLTLATLGYTGETNATADQTAAEILTAIKTVDGASSGLDADLLDGNHASAFSLTSHNHTLDSLSNTTITSIAAGEILKWNGTAWINNTLAEAGIQPAGSYLTGNQTITLSGDATGSGTTSIVVTVADDSHNHIISNVDGLQTALDGKLSTSGKAADSDLLDGIDSSAFLRSNADDSFSGLLVSSSRNNGISGTYNSTLTDQIWTMGSAYRNAANGSNFGNLYGLAYKHTNNATGGTMAGGHQMVWCQNGTGYAAMGSNIWTSGNVTAYSDIRVKTNLEIIPDAVAKVKALNGYTFDRTDVDYDEEGCPLVPIRQTGVVAQEVLAVLPEAVTGTEETHYSVAYGNMVGLLIEAIKEQQQQIDELKARLESE